MKKQWGLTLYKHCCNYQDRGRLDVSVHPFTSGLNIDDVRITSRYKESGFVEGIMAVIHEAGHALYEQGLNRKYAGLPVSQPVSSGVHESQSLFWELQIGQSKDFWEKNISLLKDILTNFPKETTIEEFYAKMNVVCF